MELMTKKATNPANVPASRRREREMQREIGVLRAKITQTLTRLDAAILQNATPVMTMQASPGYLLIVECENFAMRVRTRGVTVKASKDNETIPPRKGRAR